MLFREKMERAAPSRRPTCAAKEVADEIRGCNLAGKDRHGTIALTGMFLGQKISTQIYMTDWSLNITRVNEPERENYCS